MSNAIIETQGLTKRYGNFTAVNRLDLRLEEGEVFGFLGPNGSGKSTTILMLLGLTEPTDGMARVVGLDPTREGREVKKQVGYLPESVGFYNDLTGRENLVYTARLNNIPSLEAQKRVDIYLDMVGLSAAADQVVGQYSRGMKQRLGLADVLIKEPKLIILDDPTLGLDPTGIQWLLQLIQQMSRERSITILVSSHQLHEVQRVCNRVGIMSHGNMVLQGTMDELMARQDGGGYQLELELDSVSPGLEKDVRAMKGIDRCEVTGNRLRVSASKDVRPALLKLVDNKGAHVLELRSQNRTLEDIYLKYFQEN